MIKLSMPNCWRKKCLVSYLLLPFSWVFCGAVWLRRIYYKYFSHSKISAPVIVIGNITVGGTGKTPLVIYVVNLLKKHGYTPGVVSRGYGRKSKENLLVETNSDPRDVGDEPFLIYRRTACPVMVNPKRFLGAKELIKNHGCDIIISDDGLQHYKLPRDIEIAVVDPGFQFGNGFCLPAGPLREPVSRLKQVDFIVENLNSTKFHVRSSGAYGMFLGVTSIRQVNNCSRVKNLDDFRVGIIHAVAGTGQPARFFQTLRGLGLNIIEHPFPDHHLFQLDDFLAMDGAVIMTEKDAVKCVKIAGDDWYLEVDAKLSEEFDKKLLRKIGGLYGRKV